MSEQQKASTKITIAEAVRQAIAAGCETNDAIWDSAYAATGRFPSPSTISQVRKKLGKPASNGRGRPRKSTDGVVKLLPLKPADGGRGRPRKSKASPAITESVSAEDFVAIAKAVRPFTSKFHASTLLSLVESAISL